MTSTSGNGSQRRSRQRCFAVVATLALAVVVASCAPAPDGGTAPTTTEPLTNEPFTVFFLGDSETRMRGNTAEELERYVANLASYRSSRVEYFSHGGGIHRISPELVILGGDISADRSTSIDADLGLWKPLYDNGIAFVAGFGNHDWEPLNFGDDGPGYSVSGHLSNESTNAFTRETYRRSATLTSKFRYREVGPTSTHGPVNFHAVYRGVEIVNFNTFLYQPSYYYPEGWPLTCNLLGGGAGCQIFASAEPQIERMANLLTPTFTRTALFVQHYPLSTNDNWWSDYDTSGTSIAQKKARLLGLMSRFEHVALFAGHNHSDLRTTHQFAGRSLPEYVAPYFGGGNGDDPSRGGGFLALLVSPTKGILEVRTVLAPV
jgi:hypothetical protein